MGKILSKTFYPNVACRVSFRILKTLYQFVITCLLKASDVWVDVWIFMYITVIWLKNIVLSTNPEIAR